MKVIHTATVTVSGNDGFPFYRIPGLTVTEKGTLLLYCECRNGADWSVSEIGLYRSSDGGRTWEPRRKIGDGKGKNTVNNPVMLSLPDGRICFIYEENYKRAFRAFSYDDGKSFADVEEITDAFEDIRGAYPWTIIATGPGHGILTSRGRIIIPVWMAQNKADIFAHWPSWATVLYSDDYGNSFTVGDKVPFPDELNPSESALAELPDSRILMNCRNISEMKKRRIAVSDDGVGGWQDLGFEQRLTDPVCAAGLTRIPGGLLFSNCDSPDERTNLTVKKLSFDGEVTDTLWLYEKAGYSDIVYSPISGRAYCAFESDSCGFIRIAEIEI